jgi:hypothetical protein
MRAGDFGGVIERGAWQAGADVVQGAPTTPEVRVTTQLTLTEAMDNIYASLKDNNRDIDQHITALKAAMQAEGVKEATFEPTKLAQNNRQGRKMMQAYFRKKGVSVAFSS